MPINPKTPSTLLRSLGADESVLEAKLRVSAREAEQRWPLFRALAPAKSEAPPPLSDADKQAWEHTATPAVATRKPLLSRPGLSSKLSSGLEKFAAAPLPARKTKPAKDDAPREQTSSLPNSTRATARSPEFPSTNVEPPRGTGLFAAAEPKAARATLFAAAAPAAPLPPAQAKGSLFGGRTAPLAAQRTGVQLPPDSPVGHVPATTRGTPTRADDSLAALFERVEGKSPATTSPLKGTMSSVMRRIGKR